MTLRDWRKEKFKKSKGKEDLKENDKYWTLDKDWNMDNISFWRTKPYNCVYIQSYKCRYDGNNSFYLGVFIS